MRLFAAVRDPREYRRGMVLGLTLAETLLLLMFLLLMALGALLWRREVELAAAMTDAATAAAKAADEQHKREKLTSALASLIPELREHGVAVPDAETLAAALVAGEQAQRETEALRSQLAEARAAASATEVERARLARQLAPIERQLGPGGAADLARTIERLEQERDRAVAEGADASRRLSDLRGRIARGGGLHPPCGPDEFSFRVTILDGDRVIVDDVPSRTLHAHEAWSRVRPFPRNTRPRGQS